MTKYAANCFLATKISFMNEVARLCDIVGADVEEVRHGISTDSRIGSQFLYPGPGYGGSCFPKDVKALVFTARENGIRFKIVEAVEEVNKEQKRYMVGKVIKHFNNDVKGKTFVLWGTAFKANTDDIRETPSIDTAIALHEAGAKVRFHDPEAADNFEKHMVKLGIPVDQFENKYDALNGADGLIVMTEWKQYRAPDFEEMKSRLRTAVMPISLMDLKHLVVSLLLQLEKNQFFMTIASKIKLLTSLLVSDQSLISLQRLKSKESLLKTKWILCIYTQAKVMVLESYLV